MAPSAGLLAQIEHSLGNEVAATTATAGVLPKRAKARMNWFTLGLSLAAVTALLLLARVNSDRTPAQPPTLAKGTATATGQQIAPTRALVPDGLTRVVYNRSDEGLVFPRGSGAPLRRVRSQSQETLHWKDASTGASLRVTYPTEEIELLPIPVQ